jgi:hypothetical protein
MKSWIVGSVALAVASVLSNPECPTNMNIITHRHEFGTWLQFFIRESGFNAFSATWSTGVYATTGRRVLWLRHPLIHVRSTSFRLPIY